jgi:geranylgeranyl pyrophosphate synthase
MKRERVARLKAVVFCARGFEAPSDARAGSRSPLDGNDSSHRRRRSFFAKMAESSSLMNASNFKLENFLSEGRQRVDAALEACLTIRGDDPARLREGMRYAVLQGGKRMRPMVILAAAQAVGAQAEEAIAACCALEMIHAYSLVHDDLPAMDNDVERRGKPTVHVAFGHGNAILIGDALLTEAFAVLAREAKGRARERIGEAVAVLARCAGIDGMVGGQALDLNLGQSIAELSTLERVHALKTGALYAASGALGALAGAASPADVAKLERWGLCFGIAFQHADDILDDEQKNLRGAAIERTRALIAECHSIAADFGERGQALAAIADWVGSRVARALAGDLSD